MGSNKITTQIRNQIASNNTIETGKSSVAEFANDFKANVKQNLQAVPEDFLSQLLGLDTPESKFQPHGDMKAGQEFSLPKAAKKEKPQPEHRPHIEAGIDYHRQIVHNRERMSSRENQEIKYQIQQITEELQRLVASADSVIKMTYGDVGVSSTPAIVGKYHTNFFSWMLIVIRSARQKVEESGAWLQVAKGKGNSKGYQNMSKSHGTSFSMSNERTVATQSG